MVKYGDRYYRPTVRVLEMLNSIPEHFDSTWMPMDKAAQIIGQSICCKLHHAIMDSVSKHIRRAAAMLTQPKQLPLFN